MVLANVVSIRAWSSTTLCPWSIDLEELQREHGQRRASSLMISRLLGMLKRIRGRNVNVCADFVDDRTGIILFAKGAITYFGGTNGLRNTNSIKKAFFFLKRAVYVLQKTHGPEMH